MKLRFQFRILLAGLLFLSSQVMATPPFTFNGGVTVFEAEDFSTNISPRSSHEWVLTNVVSGFSSNGYMEGTPNNDTSFFNWVVTSPELQYGITLPAISTYYTWVRGYAIDPSSDSIHWGLDGKSNASATTWIPQNSWVWTNNAATTINITNTGLHTFSLWIREDGVRIDRLVLTYNTNFQPRTGNAWHTPSGIEPGIPSMRLPFSAIFSNTPVILFSGNQFQGGVNGANQLGTGSAIFYKNATNSSWTELPMFFNSQSGNNKYYTNAIPANTFRAGDVVQYYMRIPYSDRLPTFLFSSNAVSAATEIESVAQANPFSYLVQDTPPAGYPSPDDWRDMSIYMLMTDRYCDGDPSNNDLHPEEPARYNNGLGIHGGDFKGLQSKLDYIKALGATAIWVTPVFLTAGTNTGYHGYTAQNFYEISPTWGGLTAVTNMIAAAHQRGLRVILDIVCNHQGNRIDSADLQWTNAFKLAGYEPRWTIPTNQYPAPFNQLTNFHNYGHISDYNNDQQVELGELRGLDDLRTETEYVRTNMLDIYKRCLFETDVDAYRLDALKHVDIAFWQLFNPEMRAYAAAMGKTNFFQFGESVSGDAKNGSYTGTKQGAAFANDSVLDFALYNTINSVFINGGNTKQIEDHYNAITNNYDPAAWYRLVTFIDNHDRTRFMNSASATTNKLNVALDFLYTARGVPCLYYGTEQNFNGANLGTGSIPTNREDMFAGQFELGPSIGDNFNETKGTFLLVAKLNNLRRLYPSLLRGTHVNLWNTAGSAGLFAYARRLGSEEVFVVFNTAATSQTLTNRATIYAPGTKLVNLLNTNETTNVTAGGTTPPIAVPSSSAKIFIGGAFLKPLDPVVISQSPQHALTNVPVSSSIVLQFSLPMDTSSVQAAFSLTPSVSGAFSWSASHDTMTFTPGGLGLAGLTTNLVRVGTNAMDSISSNHLYAPFDTFFHTESSSVTDAVPPSISIALPIGGAVLTGPAVVSGMATDNVAVQGVEVRVDSGDWFAATGTTSWTTTFNSTLFPNGSHVLNARASDSSGNISSNAGVSVSFFNVPDAYEQRISPGNSNDVTNCDARVWVKDRAFSSGSFGYSGGSSGLSANTISGVCAGAQSLYQSERFCAATDAFDYLFDAPNGDYEVTLLEAETSATGTGQRTFNLFLQANQVLTNFDIYAASGGMNIPVAQLFSCTVTNNRMTMHFVGQVGNARASGIQVKKTADVDTDADGLPDWWMLGYFDHLTGQEGDSSRPEDDNDQDGLSNLEEFLSGTDPTDAASFHRVLDIALGGGRVISFLTFSGRNYVVQYNAEVLGSSGWTNLPPIVQGSGAQQSVTDSISTDRRYYRVLLEKP